MTSETLIKCAHPPCQCLVEAEQRFCSSACATAHSSHGPCMCGHAGCMGEHDVSDTDDSVTVD
jgi:hypothetical protein